MGIKYKTVLAIVIVTLIVLVASWFLFFKGIYLKEADRKLSGELTIYNWKDYIGKDTVANFEKEFGVKVNYLTFDDEEELFSALQSASSKYDLVIASNDVITALVQARLLDTIDYTNIPNIKNIGEKFRNPPYDPENKHSVPYLWGTTGVIINSKHISGNPDSWSLLWDPVYRGKIAMLNNLFATFMPAFLMHGIDFNTNDLHAIAIAEEELFKQRPLIVGYLEVTDIRDKMVSGDLWAAQIYSGEAMQAIEKNKDLRYFIPKEGSDIWVDNWAIPMGAHHKYTAEAFINYVLRPKVSAAIVNELWFANPNIAARPFTDEEMLNDPLVYPPSNILDKCHMWHDVGTPEEIMQGRSKMNEIWETLKFLGRNEQ
ncbi:MAG: spermidine/putrescine ABC transporter substrate-binding protein [Pseudomonadota bacterium]